MSMRSPQENLYLQRINTVIGYARENLNDDLSLEALARMAGFSPFHFHRIFKSISGDTVMSSCNRESQTKIKRSKTWNLARFR
jgi:AraC family transcriptional regulator